jgi:hypothetical protein
MARTRLAVASWLASNSTLRDALARTPFMIPPLPLPNGTSETKAISPALTIFG